MRVLRRAECNCAELSAINERSSWVQCRNAPRQGKFARVTRFVSTPLCLVHAQRSCWSPFHGAPLLARGCAPALPPYVTRPALEKTCLQAELTIQCVCSVDLSLYNVRPTQHWMR